MERGSNKGSDSVICDALFLNRYPKEPVQERLSGGLVLVLLAGMTMRLPPKNELKFIEEDMEADHADG